MDLGQTNKRFLTVKVYGKTLHFLLIIGLLLPISIWGGEELSEIRQITTHPQMDFAPSVSPDGRWLAFTSERSGNLDIWIKRLPRGRTIQVTSHRSEDISPVWSADGKWLAFVSKRRDTEGDIWIIKINRKSGVPKGKPVQLTDYLGLDRKPSFSPDGKKIAFVSDRSGIWNVWTLELSSKKTEQITRNGGTDPAWSPNGEWILFTSFRFDDGGDLFIVDIGMDKKNLEESRNVFPLTMGDSFDGQGCWSPGGNEVAFIRISQDTNKDKKITPDDNGSIWRKRIINTENSYEKIITEDLEIQITTNYYRDYEPCWCNDGEIFFSSYRGGGLDIWTIPDEGLFEKKSSAWEQYISTLENFGEAITKEALYQAVIGYQRVKDYFPDDSILVARSLVQQGEVFRFLGEERLAAQVLNKISEDYSNQRRESARAELKIVSLTILSISDRIERCLNVIKHYPDLPSTVAEAWIILGDLYSEKGEKGESLSAYSQVIQSFSHLRNWMPLAQLKAGDLLYEEGQIETAQESYYAVLREFGNIPIWRKRAADRLMAQVRGSFQKRIEGYQRIVQQASDFPSLAAEAQLTIGNNLIKEAQYEQALRELEKVEEIVPSLYWAHAKAMILKAEVYALMGDELKGQFILKEVMKSYDNVEGGYYAQEAKDQMFRLLFNSGERLKDAGDFALAASRYRKAMKIYSDDIYVHRGLIETMYRSGKIRVLIEEYKEDLKTRPNDPILLYGLGLAYSYYGEKEQDLLDVSNILLEKALAEDYRLIYPYRTLSFNYELMEKLKEKREQKRQGLLIRIGKTVIAPVKWFIGVLPFGSIEEERGFYEKAIHVLTTAIELNDETQNPHLEALLIQNLANNFYNLGEFGFPRAFEYYQRRLDLDTTFIKPLEKAVFFERAGRCGIVMENAELAELYLKKAISIYLNMGRKENVVRNQGMLAFLYQLNAQYEEAITIFEKILSRDKLLGRNDDVERGYRNIAFSYHLMGEPEDALKYARKAEKILTKKNFHIKPRKKSYPQISIFGLSFNIPIFGMETIGGVAAEGLSTAEKVALVYGLISLNTEALKQYPEAIIYEKKRLAIYQKRKDKLSERITITRLGILYYKMAEFEQAWKYFYRVWKKCKKVKDAHGCFVNVVNMGNVATVEYSLFGNIIPIEKSRQIIEEELIKLNSEQEGAFREKMVLFNLLGTFEFFEAKNILNKKGIKSEDLTTMVDGITKLNKAQNYFQNALDIARKNHYWRNEGVFLKNLAEVSQAANDNLYAFELLKKSYQVLEAGGDEDLLWRVQYSMATLLCQIKNQDEDSSYTIQDAIEIYRKAMNRLEDMPVQEEGSEERLSDRHDRWALYVDAASAMINGGLFEEALEVVERGKEKIISDLLARRPPRLKKERHKIAWGNLRYVRSRLGELRSIILEEEIGKNRLYLLEKWRNDRERYEKEYQELFEEIREEDGVLAYLTGAEPVDLNLTRTLFKSDKGALCYLMDKKESYIWAIDSDTIIFKTIPMGKDFFKQRIYDFIQNIQKDSLSEIYSGLFYKYLIDPVAEFINDKSWLLIIPDKELWNLPFEAFSKSGETLLDTHTLYYASSLTTYRLAQEKRKINQDNILFVSDATKEKLKNEAKSADVIQFENWIDPIENNPLMSTITLSSDVDHSESLPVEDIFSWDVKASLCLLPARKIKGKSGYYGIQSIITSLLYAGVPSVVTTMWPVDDDVKSLFLKVFYMNIKDLSLSDAIAEAQLAVKEIFPGIRAWASFRLVGFEGMDYQERNRFAKEWFVSSVIRARTFGENNEHVDAIKTYEKALDMAKIIGDSIGIHKIYYEIIKTANNGKLWDKAIAYQKRIIKNEEKLQNLKRVMSGLKNLAAFYFQDKQFEKAASIKLKLIEFISKTDSKRDLGSAYEELASIYAANRNYDKAVKWIDEAFTIYYTLSDSLAQGIALIWKGRFYLDGEDYWKARTSFGQGIQILINLRRNSDSLINIEFYLATGYQLLGLALEKLSQYKEAFNNQEEGLKIFKALRQNKQIAQGYQYLANIYWKMGNYRNALTYQRKALTVFETLEDYKLLAMGYGTMGLIHMSLGDILKAKTAEEKALDLAEMINNQEDMATYLKNMGLINIQEGNLNDAFQLFQQAAIIDSVLGLKRGLAYDYRNMGNILILQNRPQRSLSYLKSSLHLSREISDRRNIIQSFYGLAQSYKIMKKLKMAKSVIDSGIVEAQGLVIPEILWRLYRERANILSESGANEVAFLDYQRAVIIVEQMRAELKVESFKQGFLDNKMDLYVDVVTNLLNMNREKESFNFVERAKSRNFIDLLSNQDIAIPKAQGELLKKEQQAKIAIEEAQTALTELNKKTGLLSNAEKQQKDIWEEELANRRKIYEELLISIQAENPELASFVSVDPIVAEEIQSLLPDSTALIEYFLTSDILYIWIVLSEDVIAFQIKIKQNEILLWVKRFRETIQAYLSPDRESRKLYEWLFQPIEQSFRNIKHLVIVPHGVLHYLPFTALQNEDGEYLIERYSISLVPSATVLGYSFKKEVQRLDKNKEKTILALGNPDLGDSMYDLIFAEKEVRSIGRAFNNLTVFLGDQATEDVIYNLANEKNIIHFACHATYEPETPLFSSLLLSPSKTNNGRLEAHEIFGLSLNCEVVTLSACESGLGKITNGDEIIGLARGFIFAGTPSIITSLWKVDDLATAVMIKRFYRYLAAGFSKAEALRRAQILVKTAVNSHPAAWSAFTLTGDFR
jgi:CHAT domain-containing protein/lipopolysaccharide biosynthesis regulator YciM